MKNLLITLLFLIPIGLFAQNVGINDDGSAPNPGAILDIKSADKGILIPRLESSAVATPVEGMLIFQPSDQQFYFYKNSSWTDLGAGTGVGGEFISNGDLIYNAGTIDAEDFLFGRSVRPGFSNISDKFLYYEQNTGAFRGGEVVNSQVWNQINMGKNSFAYGKNVEVDGDNSHSLGVQNIVDGSSAFAFGVRDTVAGFIGSGAIGEENNNAGGYGTVVIGKQNQVFAGASEGSIAMGKGNKLGPDSDHGSIVIGMDNSNASGYGSVVMGYKNAALTDSGAITIGKGLINNYDQAVIMGRYNAYSNYIIDPVLAIGNGDAPYDFNNPRHDAFSLLSNGYAGFNWNYPENTLTVKNVGESIREGITVLGDDSNTHVNLILKNRGNNGRAWSMVSSGGGSILGNGKFAIRDITAQKEAIVIDSFYNVGIRTSTPTDDLEIKMIEENVYGGISVIGASNTKGAHLVLGTFPSGGSRFVMSSTGQDAPLGPNKLVFRAGSLPSDHIMVLQADGKVGIGQSNPEFDLTVGTDASDDGGILIRGGSSTNRPMLKLENNGFQGRTYSVFSSGQTAGVGRGKYVVRDETRSWNVFIIDSTGNTGIGLIAPKERLDVDGAIRLNQAQGNFAGTIQFESGEFKGYNGTEWVNFGAGGSTNGSSLLDANSDTRIELELTPNDDIIRFSLDNFNRFMMEKNPGEIARLRFVNTSDNIVLGSGEATEGTDNRSILIGNDAGINHTDASNDNVFIGDGAGKDGKGESMIAIGTNALSNSEIGGLRTGTIAIGHDALTAITPTSGGIFPALAIGYEAGKDATSTGIYIGYKAGQSTTGGNNTILGNNAGINITSGYNNIIVGSQTGTSLTTGRNNVFIGSGFMIATGFNNTHVGENARASGDFNNSTALGHDAVATASNQVRIGHTTIGSIGGNALWTNFSDKRFKKSIKEDIPGLAFIQKLRPVSYNLDISAFEEKYGIEKATTKNKIAAKRAKEKARQTGFIAQEVEQISKNLGFEFSGVDAPKNENDHYGLRYAAFVVPLVKAVQEQQEQIETLKTEHAKEISELKNMIQALADKIEK